MRGTLKPVWITCRHCGQQTECRELPNKDVVFCQDCGLLLAEPGMVRLWPHLLAIRQWAALTDRPHLGSWWNAECESGHKRWLTLPLLSTEPRDWRCSCGSPIKWGSGRALKPWEGPEGERRAA